MKIKIGLIFFLITIMAPSIEAMHGKKTRKKQEAHRSLPRVKESPLLAEAYYICGFEHLAAAFFELKKYSIDQSVIALHFENALNHANKSADHHYEKSSTLIYLTNRYRETYENVQNIQSIPLKFTEAMWHFLSAITLKNKFLHAPETANSQMLLDAEHHLKTALESFVLSYNSGYCQCIFETKLAHDLLKNIQTIKAEKLYNSFWPCKGMQYWEDVIKEIKTKENLK